MNNEMQWVVEYIRADGSKGHSSSMNKLSCEYAKIIIPGAFRIVPACEVLNDYEKQSAEI